MTPTTGDDGAVKLAASITLAHALASSRGLHHPPLDHDQANRLAQAVLTLTAQLQAANERADRATAGAAVLLKALSTIADQYVPSTVGVPDDKFAEALAIQETKLNFVTFAREHLDVAPLATAMLSELTALREVARGTLEEQDENYPGYGYRPPWVALARAALTRTETTDG